MKRDTAFRGAIIVFLSFAMAIVPAVAETGTSFLATVPALRAPDLVEKASVYDGVEVKVEGEIIGEVMARGDHSWINILDNGTALGVWLEKNLLPEIAYIGSYEAIGDKVRVTGAMHRACPEHGGDLDIHADTIELIGRGSAISHTLDLRRLGAAAALCVSGAFLAVLWRKRESRKKIS
ncbi:MAG TPA: hypothetical protein VN445_01595 [Rectinemataceae bacterium]|nr:hypothetical protein [Rectinemataceae bacterium]